VSVCLCMCMCTCVYVYAWIRVYVCVHTRLYVTHTVRTYLWVRDGRFGRVCREEYLVLLHDTGPFVRTCARAHVRQFVYKLHTRSISDTVGKWESAVFEGEEGGRGGNLAFFHTFVRTCDISFALFCPIYFVLSNLNMWVIAMNLIMFVWEKKNMTQKEVRLDDGGKRQLANAVGEHFLMRKNIWCYSGGSKTIWWKRAWTCDCCGRTLSNGKEHGYYENTV